MKDKSTAGITPLNLNSLNLYLPVDIYTDDNPVPDSKSAQAYSREIPDPAFCDVFLLVEPDSQYSSDPGLYYKDSTQPIGFSLCAPFEVINNLILSGGYCKIYTGTRTAVITPDNPKGAEYDIYLGDTLQSGNDIPQGSKTYTAIYKGVPFLLTPADVNGSLGGVRVPPGGAGPVTVNAAGTLSVIDATSSAKGLVQFIAGKSDIINHPQAASLAVDQKNLSDKFDDYAPLKAPAFITDGANVPTSATPGISSPATMIATKEYVDTALNGVVGSNRQTEQVWDYKTATGTTPPPVPFAVGTIGDDVFQPNNRIDFSFTISDSSPVMANGTKPSVINPKSTHDRGVRLVLESDAGESILIGAQITDAGASLSGEYIGAKATTDIKQYKQTYIDKKVTGSIWQDASAETYFMVTITELGVGSASVSTSVPVKLDAARLDWTRETTLTAYCTFSAGGAKDATYIIDSEMVMIAES